MFSSIKRFFINNPSESLFKKTAKGSFWLLVFRIFDQSFGLIGTIILARLLAPSDFGLFGITLLAASFLDTFSQTGFQPALVHKKGDIRPYLDTSFIVQVIRGFLIALIIFVSAPYIAIFFKVEAAVPILRIMGFAIFIQGLENIATIYLQKELEFITLFLGEKWLPSLWPMRIISLSVSMWMVAVVSNYMFLAIGRPNVTTRWTSIKLLILIIFLYPFIIKYNITGASIVVLVSSLVATFGLAFEAIRTIKCSLVQFINNVIFSFINALIMAVSVYFLKGYFPYGILGFLATVLAGILIYFFLTLLSDKIFNDKAFQLVKETVGLLK